MQNSAQLLECQESLRGQYIIGVDVEFTTIQHIEANATDLQESELGKPQEEDFSSLLSMGIASVQLSTPENSFFIAEFLRPLFESHNILKIFHSCDNDVKLISSVLGIYPQNIFDTEKF